MSGIRRSTSARPVLGILCGGQASTHRSLPGCSCQQCSKTLVHPPEPLLPSSFPELPWNVLVIDLFHWNKQDFIVIVNYHSRYPQVLTLRSTSSCATIAAMKSVFGRHGIPRSVRNGPQFASGEFIKFAQNYGFDHKTSSIRFP